MEPEAECTGNLHRLHAFSTRFLLHAGKHRQEVDQSKYEGPGGPSERPSKGENMHLLWWIIVGLIAGWVTGKIMKGTGYGAIWDIVLGIAGAIVGGWIMRMLGGTGQGGTIYTILVAIGGAVILTFLFRLVTGNKSRGDTGGIRRAA